MPGRPWFRNSTPAASRARYSNDRCLKTNAISRVASLMSFCPPRSAARIMVSMEQSSTVQRGALSKYRVKTSAASRSVVRHSPDFRVLRDLTDVRRVPASARLQARAGWSRGWRRAWRSLRHEPARRGPQGGCVRVSALVVLCGELIRGQAFLP